MQKTAILEVVEIAFFISLNDVGDLREEIERSIHTEQEPEVWNSSVLVSCCSTMYFLNQGHGYEWL